MPQMYKISLIFTVRLQPITKFFFLWRPFLPDPKDDMVLELAVKAGCDSVVTYNIRDFAGIERFGVSAVTPANFLESIGALS